MSSEKVDVCLDWTDKPVTKDENPRGAVCESSFAILFPKYREKYIRETWALVKEAMRPYGVVAELDLIEGTLQVKSTRRMYDPYSIINARDVIKLISRGVPYDQALRIMEDEYSCEIVKLSSFVRNKERFVKRRKRLIGSEGQTLKALELLTKCYILVQGHTISIIGSREGVKQVRQIAEDCMRNTHPIYSIKRLMIMRELRENPELRNESWERFLPHFRCTTRQRKRKNIKWRPKRTALFPPDPTPRKVDIELETGEFFMSKQARDTQERHRKLEKQAETTRKRRLEKERKLGIPPTELLTKGRRAGKNDGGCNKEEMDPLNNIKSRMKLGKA